jgi:hypothetical protein
MLYLREIVRTSKAKSNPFFLVTDESQSLNTD